MTVLAVGVGGFLGAIARYGVGVLLPRASDGSFPWATLVVNVTGCAAIGVLMALADHRDALSPTAHAFATVGLLGAFTTFSAFGHETLALLRAGHSVAAILNVAANVVLGLAAVALGRAVAGNGA